MPTVEALYKKATMHRAESILEARDNFVKYCQLKDNAFYTEDKPHLTELCQVLDDFYKGLLIRKDGKAYRKLMISIPPQHGKTRTLINFSQFALGNDNETRIILGSYNDDTAGDFSKYTRNGIQEKKNLEEQIVFSDIFPETTIAQGTATMSKWALTGQHFNYMGGGIHGSFTGKGGNILIIDDPIKSQEIAVNEMALQKIWDWYTGTYLSRVSAKAGLPLEIFNMTRWASLDPCGRILDSDEKDEWYVLKMEAYNKKTASMLCDSLLGFERYEELKKKMQPEIFNANYHQEPIDLEGTLYKSFKTYTDLPKDIEEILNYTDTADEGSDYLCSINFAVCKNEAYILDILYTQKGMEVTEGLTAKFLFDGEVNMAMVESNNGGRGFARNVIRLLRENHKSNRSVVKWFHQSKNKVARIITNSHFVMEHIYYPHNWKSRFPEFYQSMVKYQKAGKNKFDDAEDTITGVAETFDKKRLVAVKLN